MVSQCPECDGALVNAVCRNCGWLDERPLPVKALPLAYRAVPERVPMLEPGVCGCGKTVDEHRAEFRANLAILATKAETKRPPLVATSAPVTGYREPEDVARLERRRVEMLEAFARHVGADLSRAL